MENMNFDLVEELGKKLSGIWRFDKYVKDTQEHSCPGCTQMWKKIKEMDEKAAEMLRAEIVNHVKADKFS